MLKTRYDAAVDSFNDHDNLHSTAEETILADSFKEALSQYSEGLINSVELFQKLSWEAHKVDWATASAQDIIAHWNTLPRGVPVSDTHDILAVVSAEAKADLVQALNCGWVKVDFSNGWSA